MARLQDFYRKDVVPELMKKFGYKTTMQVPRSTCVPIRTSRGESTPPADGLLAMES